MAAYLPDGVTTATSTGSAVTGFSAVSTTLSDNLLGMVCGPHGRVLVGASVPSRRNVTQLARHVGGEPWAGAPGGSRVSARMPVNTGRGWLT